MTSREAVLHRMEELGIPVRLTEHPAMFTIEQMREHGVCRQGEVCKNLFLRDAKGKRHFLVTVPAEKRVDLAILQQRLGTTRLSFGSAERLERHLCLCQGEVGPMGVLNDLGARVEVVFDRALMGRENLGVHPNDNTATLWLSFADLVRIVEGNGNTIHMVDLG